MFKIRNTGVADKLGFRHICCVAAATKIIMSTLLWKYEKAKIKCWLLGDFWPDFGYPKMKQLH